MKYTFNQNSWAWHELDQYDPAYLKKILGESPSLESWLDGMKDDISNSLRINTSRKGEEFIWGSIVYQQDVHSESDKLLFHFYLSKDFFITVNLDFEVLPTTDFSTLKAQMDNADNAMEGFFVLLGEILTDYLIKIDAFEERLTDLLWNIKQHNNIDILEKIYDNRHELLIWRNLIIPIMEIKIGAEEAFGNEISSKTEFRRLCKRVDRGRTLLNEYQQEIDTMINLEEVLSSHRGNEIFKTLTVITILFTPVMAWGALWGMNFEHMPELKWKYGYAAAGVLIVASTLGIYFYLKMKGWMGDILRGKKRDSFFK
ncbi:magnesium transporter CorA family protein [Bacillus sp. T33-2]|uniref:magnesium transporter CorA family protein n=1 Tax=Bacillus sp. T33-2 TaxID=2054168 RepID=UPI000C78AE79|nr:magnesium transporter CorA family protein [Bacillus sp. T33-2]PLR96083.1 Mg2+ transporter protein, CorA-like protein [Bacillus sp. T33-2]